MYTILDYLWLTDSLAFEKHSLPLTKMLPIDLSHMLGADFGVYNICGCKE